MHVGMAMDVRATVIVLRDPVERWLTGIAQHITTNILGENFGSTHFIELANDLVDKIIFDQIVFDDHTEQQSWFLEPFDLDQAVFFYCDQNLSKNLDNYFDSMGHQYKLSDRSFVNASKDQFDNANLIEYFRNKVYNNQTYYNKLKEYYVRDYDLISSVKFYAR